MCVGGGRRTKRYVRKVSKGFLSRGIHTEHHYSTPARVILSKRDPPAKYENSYVVLPVIRYHGAHTRAELKSPSSCIICFILYYTELREYTEEKRVSERERKKAFSPYRGII